eukprot:Opistho-1_new@42075
MVQKLVSRRNSNKRALIKILFDRRYNDLSFYSKYKIFEAELHRSGFKPKRPILAYLKMRYIIPLLVLCFSTFLAIGEVLDASFNYVELWYSIFPDTLNKISIKKVNSSFVEIQKTTQAYNLYYIDNSSSVKDKIFSTIGNDIRGRRLITNIQDRIDQTSYSKKIEESNVINGILACLLNELWHTNVSASGQEFRIKTFGTKVLNCYPVDQSLTKPATLEEVGKSINHIFNSIKLNDRLTYFTPLIEDIESSVKLLAESQSNNANTSVSLNIIVISDFDDEDSNVDFISRLNNLKQSLLSCCEKVDIDFNFVVTPNPVYRKEPFIGAFKSIFNNNCHIHEIDKILDFQDPEKDDFSLFFQSVNAKTIPIDRLLLGDKIIDPEKKYILINDQLEYAKFEHFLINVDNHFNFEVFNIRCEELNAFERRIDLDGYNKTQRFKIEQKHKLLFNPQINNPVDINILVFEYNQRYKFQLPIKQ